MKLNRMSTSLRNARSQISALHGRLEGLNLLNMDNVQAMVDRQVENITGVVNKLSSTCNNACPFQTSPQCKALSHKFISLLKLWICGCIHLDELLNILRDNSDRLPRQYSLCSCEVCFFGQKV